MFRLVAIDHTRYWSQECQKLGGQIFSRYVYNDTSATYCCELTPSREMHFVGYEATNYLENDKDREKLFDMLIEAEVDEDVMYMHCRCADRLVFSEIKADDIEEAVEYCRCNVFLPEGLSYVKAS